MAASFSAAVASRDRSAETSWAADTGDGLALTAALLSSGQFAKDLLGVVAFAFHGDSPGEVWPVRKLSKGLVQSFGSTSVAKAVKWCVLACGARQVHT